MKNLETDTDKLLADKLGIDADKIWKRFWPKVNVRLPEDCWEWQANLAKGYGVFWFGKIPMMAHRLSWMMLRGPIPEGMNVLHKCDNRKCVNPNHLFLGTQSDNVQDMFCKGRQGDPRTGIVKGFSHEDSEKIHDLLNRGYSLRYVASEYKTTHQTIQRALADGRI